MIRHGIGFFFLATTLMFIAGSCGIALGIDGEAAIDPCGELDTFIVNTCGKGTCFRIVRACNDNGTSAPPCTPGEPEAEICDKLDNDCDGAVDEECVCDPQKDLTQSCYLGSLETRNVGLCQTGTQRCLDGVWGPCVGSVLPTYDLIDSFDNDCNGVCDDPVDEPTAACTDLPCYSGPSEESYLGVCRIGLRSCKNFVYTECKNEVRPSLEVCNGLDDDCNGAVDDLAECECFGNEILPCYAGNMASVGVGACKKGHFPCNGGRWDTTTCIDEVLPADEVCNGLDDDCNGIVDDAAGLGLVCPTKLPGLCQFGKTGCGIDDRTGLPGTICTPDVKPFANIEVACNLVDDNCDGTIDEGTVCCPDDGIQNGNETDVNCGGTCPQRCADGKKCNTAADCASQVCVSGICAQAQCTDATKNGTETDIDCGGPNCLACTAGRSCTLDLDCQSGMCISNICAP